MFCVSKRKNFHFKNKQLYLFLMLRKNICMSCNFVQFEDLFLCSVRFTAWKSDTILSTTGFGLNNLIKQAARILAGKDLKQYNIPSIMAEACACVETHNGESFQRIFEACLGIADPDTFLNHLFAVCFIAKICFCIFSF